MISINEAQQTILDTVMTLETEKVSLLKSLNRITAEDHIASWDIPPTDNSAMDGYAFSSAAVTGISLPVSGFLPAGEERCIPVAPGEAVRIMTGAPIPSGCDTVVPLEEVVVEGNSIRITSLVRKGSHVRRRGEDVRQGTVVITAGSLLRPQEIGILSAMGTTSPDVYRKARVAIIATGDELLEPGATPASGRIIDSNSYSLAAQVLDAGGDPLLVGIAPDDLDATCDKIRAGLSADFVVISGGVSAGDRDFVRMAIERLGGTISFWKVNMKPGKPVAFALLDEKPVLALPGNPVAAMVSFELFVRPALLKAMGHRKIFRPEVTAIIDEPIMNPGSRPHLIRGLVTTKNGRYHVTTTGNQSSGRLSSLVLGNALIRLEHETSIQAGTETEVMLLDRSFGKEY